MSESGKVVVTKSKLDELANSINNKANSPGPKTIAQLTQTVNDMQTGGSSVFLVTLTTDRYNSNHGYGNDQVTADKSFTEISTAYNNGNIVRAKWGNWILDLVHINITDKLLAFAACMNSEAFTANMLISVMAQCMSGESDAWTIGYWGHNIPKPSNYAPEAPGTEDPGVAAEYARGDHVHPKELPTVTDTDNGKFLRVANGAWAAVEIANANGVSF